MTVSSGRRRTSLAVDAQLDDSATLWFDYHCKLQSLTYPYVIGEPVPWVDIPGARRDVSWRAGEDPEGADTSGPGVSISMQSAVNAPALSQRSRSACALGQRSTPLNRSLSSNTASGFSRAILTH